MKAYVQPTVYKLEFNAEDCVLSDIALREVLVVHSDSSVARYLSNVVRRCWLSSSSFEMTRFKLAMKHLFRSRVILACILFRSRLRGVKESSIGKTEAY
jgi:hypothetical protein